MILAINHIEQTPGVIGGVPRIAGRRIGVHDIVILHDLNGLDPEGIARDYDLSLAQVYSALAYYYDHQDEIEQIIREENEAEERFGQDPSPELQAEFKRRFGEHQAELNQEMTPPEIAHEFGISEQAVRKAAHEGWVQARKAGKIWMIRRRDAFARWGRAATR